ncbi:MAG TPA: DUF4360 domain-containing protein [Devosia sp.]|nr:DUF4360 domain-containing protein [Devosia sp.]
MKVLAAVATLVVVAGVTGFAYADDISLGTPGYGGTGCPGGSVDTVLSPDAKSLSILFDSYVVDAGGDTGKTFDRKSCNIAIPVHVPQGLSISVLAIDYRGSNTVPAGGQTDFNVEYFFAGTRGPTFKKTFKGPIDGQDFTIHNDLTASAMVWSACGADVNLRTNSSIRVATKNNAQAEATVDSEDVNAAIVYQLQWKKC